MTMKTIVALPGQGNFGDGWAYFESVHGSVPDIAGKSMANQDARDGPGRPRRVSGV